MVFPAIGEWTYVGQFTIDEHGDINYLANISAEEYNNPDLIIHVESSPPGYEPPAKTEARLIIDYIPPSTTDIVGDK